MKKRLYMIIVLLYCGSVISGCSMSQESMSGDDKENNNILKINERIFIVDCSIELDEFNEAFNLELEEGEYNTLNGYIINQLGEIPKSNEKVEIKVENVNIEVVKVSNKKIEKVKVSYIN